MNLSMNPLVIYRHIGAETLTKNERAGLRPEWWTGRPIVFSIWNGFAVMQWAEDKDLLRLMSNYAVGRNDGVGLIT
jgi:hypothetical protein